MAFFGINLVDIWPITAIICHNVESPVLLASSFLNRGNAMRINLRIGGSAEALLQNLAKNGGLTTREAVLDSLAILNMAVTEVQKGGKLCIQDSEGNLMAITTPTLSHVAKQKNSEPWSAAEPASA